MNYTVILSATAEAQLAEVWNAAADRNAVTFAMDEIDQRLGRDPIGFGESRAGDDRLIFYGPLMLYYRVDQSRRAVHILSIGASGRSA